MTADPRFTHEAPHEALARLIRKETGVEFDPHLLRLFIKCKWSRIHVLAHAIHGPEVADFNTSQSKDGERP